MKAKFLACVWCGGNIGGMTPQERKDSKHAVKHDSMYCSVECRKNKNAYSVIHKPYRTVMWPMTSIMLLDSKAARMK